MAEVGKPATHQVCAVPGPRSRWSGRANFVGDEWSHLALAVYRTRRSRRRDLAVAHPLGSTCWSKSGLMRNCPLKGLSWDAISTREHAIAEAKSHSASAAASRLPL